MNNLSSTSDSQFPKGIDPFNPQTPITNLGGYDVSLSHIALSTLPEELILKILNFLDIKDLGLIAQVGPLFSRLKNDESIWKVLASRINLQEDNSTSYQELVKKNPILSFDLKKKEVYLDHQILEAELSQRIQATFRLITKQNAKPIYGVRELSEDNHMYYILDAKEELEIIEMGRNNRLSSKNRDVWQRILKTKPQPFKLLTQVSKSI